MIPPVEERQVRPCYIVKQECDAETNEILVPWHVDFICKHCKIDMSDETAICLLNGKDTGWARDETCNENITNDEYQELIDSGRV